MFGYFIRRYCHRTTVTSRCLLEAQYHTVVRHPLAYFHFTGHPHKVARVVRLPFAPYAPATAPLTAYLVPLQLPVVTPVLRHDPRLAAAGEHPVPSGNDERVVGVALLNTVLVAKVSGLAAERKPAMRDVI